MHPLSEHLLVIAMLSDITFDCFGEARKQTKFWDIIVRGENTPISEDKNITPRVTLHESPSRVPLTKGVPLVAYEKFMTYTYKWGVA